MSANKYSMKAQEVVDIDRKTNRINDFVFSVAPMMDWNETLSFSIG